MGVKLDWDIEAEKGKHKEHREDSVERSARRRGFFRLIMIVLIFVACSAIAVYFIFQRWERVNTRIEDNLAETVKSEVASLRIGDFEGFMNIQRSATEDWLITQRETYENYQQLKTTSDIVLSGQVVDVEVDGQRGRVQVQEIIDGIPYLQTWFYWRFPKVQNENGEVVDDGGWHHVPPDYTFWGETNKIEDERFLIRYQGVDEKIAQAIADELERWLNDACSFLDCISLPPITVDILSQSVTDIQWAHSDPNAWQLLLPSPYIARAREDMPFDPQMRFITANLFADRLVDLASNNVSVNYPSDAFYLRSAIVNWLTGRFAQVNTEAYLITSLNNNNGINAIPSLLSQLQTGSNLQVLNSVTGTASLAEADLDWRDFVLWRLNTEDDLIRRGEEFAWTQLYDFRDPNLQTVAWSRYNNNFTADERNILEVNRVFASDGTPQLVARVQVIRGFESGEEIVVFSFFNGTWLRVN